MDNVISSLTIHISPAEWFIGIVLVFVYAFLIVHIIEKYTDNKKAANPVWFYIVSFLFAIFIDGTGKSNFLFALWASLWGAVKISVIGQGVYALLKAFNLIDKIELIMKKKLDNINQTEQGK